MNRPDFRELSLAPSLLSVTILVATTNRGKLGEIFPLLAGLAIDIRTLADYPPVAPPDETGSTFAENARQKARFYAVHTGTLTVAEDSGLEIDALEGAPGVHSARFGGETTYREKFALIEERLAQLPAAEPRGTGGFGYDPIFFYPPFGCTLAEAGERKSSVSHRGQAFRHLRQYLEGRIKDQGLGIRG